jgi:RHS repeat-associated protein
MSTTISVNSKLSFMSTYINFKKQFIYHLIFILGFILFNQSAKSQVYHVHGEFCAGVENAFVFSGETVAYWDISNGGTIVSDYGNWIIAKWDSPTSGGYVIAYYYDYYYNLTYAAYYNITISSSATPSVSISASSTNVCSGTSVTFTASPFNGGSSPYYTWYVNGNSVASGYGNTFTTNSLTNGQQVSCSMNSNAQCVTTSTANSNAITVTVNPMQTMGVTVSGNTLICEGSGVSLGAAMTNPVGTLTYQWKKNGYNVSSDNPYAPVNVLVLSTVNNGDVFSCVVSSSGCANPVTSNALTISTTQPQSFTISVSPSQIYLCQDASVTFTATSNLSAGNYQWSINGNAVPGATNSTFSTTATTVSELQSVSVSAYTAAGCVNNTYATGSAQSYPFAITPTVTPLVTITEPIVVKLGTAATFTANPVNGGNNPTYQWQLNGVNVAGATGTTYAPTITSGNQYQSIGVIMNSNAQCAINPAVASNYVEIASVNWENLNYVRVHDVVSPGKTNWIQVDGLSIGDKFQATTYLDGISRAIQTVDKLTSQLESGAWADMVTHIEYDAAGRVEKSFLPYTSSTAIGMFKSSVQTEQASFIRNKYGEDANSPTYAKLTLEQSPLGRVLNIKAPGTAFGGDNTNYLGVSSQYEFNTALESIRVWKIGGSLNSIPTSTTTYASGTLTKTVSTDEKLKKVYTYTDFEGNAILKKVQIDDVVSDNSHDGWLCTYYVYDDLGQLRSIITPKAVTYLQQNSWSFVSTDVYQELCYYYDFDERGRVIVKHSPGAGQIQMVYDKKDRLVLSQDENQRNRTSKQWSFFLYDELNRIKVDGLFDNSASRSDMANYVRDNLNNGVVSIGINANGMEGAIVDNPVAGSSTYCNNCTNTVINNIYYYDNYSFRSTRPLITDYSFASTTDPYVETSIQSSRVVGLPTGSRSRIIDQNYDDNNLNNDFYIFSLQYYDEKVRPFQNISYNIKGGENCTTMQYNFSGKLLSVCDRHSFPGSSMSSYFVISKYEYNQVGQLTRLSKKYGTQDYKKIAEYSYDEYGRSRNTKLSPDYNSGAGIESLKYDYNIQGWLTGINKDYALANSMLNQWDHFFGAYFGYDNRDNLFVDKQYNGAITGTIWKTQGDNMPRKYNYQYDNAGQLKAANFLQKEKATDLTWTNTKMDFSVTSISYDVNGNLLQMYQKGIIPGNNTPVFVDKLAYNYKQVGGAEWSNQLRKVFDQTTDLTASTNGSVGDFKDDTYGINDDDYTYDGNGNLTKDNNKKIRTAGAGVQYNFMNKPQKITVQGKSEVEFIYDATGEKIGKKVTYTQGGAWRITWYDGDYVYEETSFGIQLKMILHEEGRIRVFQPVSNSRLTQGGNFDLPGTNNKGVFEFFIKDNLQSVRMVLSEETHSEYNNCTMETANSSIQGYEERMFGQVDAANNPVVGFNEVILTRRDKSTFAPGWTSNSSANVSRLKQDEQKLGPNMILKVMAGDVINAQTNYYYTGTIDNTGSSGVLNSILTNLLTTLNNSPQTTQIKGSSSTINTNYSQNPGELGNFLSNQNNGGTTTPQAYLNILFFDENFNFVPYDNVTGLGSYGWRVGSGGNGQAPVIAPNIKVPKNGYAFVYLSNESKTPVYFDDFVVTHTRGRLIEENAYYPYGLKIKGISAKAIDKGDNKYGYQGEFEEDEEETAWDEFDLRMYDPQIGRWVGVDPYDQFASPYVGMGNNPVNNVDPDGGGISSGYVGAMIGAGVGFAMPYLIEGFGNLIGENWRIKNKGMWGALGAFIGAGVGYGIGETVFGDGTNGGAGFFQQAASFYERLFGGDGVVQWKKGLNGKPAGDFAWAPKLWGHISLKLEFPQISLTNPFVWVDDAKNVTVYRDLLDVKLGDLMDDPDFVDNFPSYKRTYSISPNNGNIQLTIDPGVPRHYKLPSFSLGGNDNSQITITLLPDIGEIIREKNETIWHRGDLDLRKRVNADDIYHAKHYSRVKVREKSTMSVPFRYLKIFGWKIWKLIRKKV